jgi:hypothetical protein
MNKFFIIQKLFEIFNAVIARLDRANQRKGLDYPVEPDNDKHWNR